MNSLPAVFPVTCHTDFVGQGTTFVVIQGLSQDGLQYVQTALQKGATTIVVAQGVKLDPLLEETIKTTGVAIHYVADTRAALATLSAQAAGFPAQRLKLLGITGTKGKSTTSHILYNLLLSAGHRVAMLNTVENRIGRDSVLPAPLTTPQPDYLHQFFKLCVDHAIEYVVMEVAAQALTFKRIETLQFDGLIFTNLDREHGEQYPTMEDYFATKCQLFKYAKPGAPLLVNADDQYGQRILSTALPDYNFLSYGMAQGADYQFQLADFCCTINGQQFEYTAFPGEFNGYNIAAALSLCCALGFTPEQLRPGLAQLPPLRGRLEQYHLANGAQVFIDYAHTPASFAGLFKAMKARTPHLIVVFGAGGGRDHQKRPLMGALAAQYADVVIVTNDNPRFEDPQIIMQDILAGIDTSLRSKVIEEPDRRLAIEKACRLSKPESIILLLGKGPDEYQLIQGQKIPFSEKMIVASFSVDIHHSC